MCCDDLLDFSRGTSMFGGQEERINTLQIQSNNATNNFDSLIAQIFEQAT